MASDDDKAARADGAGTKGASAEGPSTDSASEDAAPGASTGPEGGGGGRDVKDVTWREAVGAIGLALALPWMIGVPAYVGWYLDRKYDTWPLWFIVLLLFGLAGAAADLYKLLKQFGQFK